MAQLVVAAAGAAVGFAFGGPVGAQVGWALGSAFGAGLAPKQKIGAEPATDLSPPSAQYGAAVPRIYGRQVVTGSLVWASAYRPIATTTEQGKGGGGVESTSYSYRSDQMWLVAAETPILAITRVWDNGELVYSALADSDADTLAASAANEHWDEIELRDGNATQLPWPVYEAAVGTANALAYRDRSTICITNLNHYGSPTPRALKFEVITAGASAEAGELVALWQFDGNGTDDSGNSRNMTGGYGYEAGRFSSAARVYRDSGGTVIAGPSYGGNFTVAGASEPFTCDFWFQRLTNTSNVDAAPYWSGYRICGVDSGTSFNFEVVGDFSGPPYSHRVRFGMGSTVTYIDGTAALLPQDTSWVHVRVCRNDANLVTLFVNGAVAGTATDGQALTGIGPYNIGAALNSQNMRLDSLRMVRGYAVSSAAFTPPTAPHGPVTLVDVWTPATVDLQDVVENECALSGMDLAQLDATDLAGIEVTGLAATGSARQVLEVLQAGYYFDWVCSDKLYARLRGGSATAIAREQLAAGVGDAAEVIFDPQRGNDEEIPARVQLTYVNLNADYEPGAETGDRLVTVGGSMQQVTLPLVLTPEQGKGRAIAMALDAKNAATTATITLSDDYAALECTDCVTVPDSGGTTYRMRIVRETYADGVHQHELVLDDHTALVSTGLASDERQPSTVVTPSADTTLALLDIPILRDADNDAGMYVAVKPAGDGRWPGAAVLRAVDDSAFVNMASIPERTVIGATTTTLAAPASVAVWDDVSTVTVNVGAGTLASSTKAAMQADRTINVAALGVAGSEEIIRFVTATLVSAGVYTLSGLMRGARGTERFCGTHTSADPFVLLRNTGLRRVAGEAHELELPFYWRGVTVPRNYDTATSQTFTNNGVGLLPFAPSRLQATRDGSNNVTFTWMRRTRLTVRHIGAGGLYAPLGEDTEAYEVDVYADGTYTTVLRTLTATAETVAYSAANQTTDGLTPGDPVFVRVYQLSAVVGRGSPLEGSA